MKVANIVSNNPINVSEHFNVVKTIDEIIEGLPTLIVGYDTVNNLYPDFDILNICLEPNFYWTFKRTEKRDKFQEDLFWFMSKVYSDLIKDVKYIFVDFIQYSSRQLWKITRKILRLKNIVTFVNGDMIYIYGENLIFGIDLKLLRYIGVNCDKIKNKINLISDDFLVGKPILIEYKLILETLENKVRFIPYLHSILNGKTNIISDIHIP
jgi:hypothetical protein